MTTLFTVRCDLQNVPVILVADGLAIGLVLNNALLTASKVDAFLFEENGNCKCDASNGTLWTKLDRVPAAQLMAECAATKELDATQLAVFAAAIATMQA